MRCLIFLTFLTALPASAAKQMDLVPFGQLASFGDTDQITPLTTAALHAGNLANAGVQWTEERDVREIRIRYTSAPPPNISIQYWFHTWPYPQPEMPSIEDPVDDRWQGKWLTATILPQCSGVECVYRFAPLSKEENPRASNQPGVIYRRTLKIRIAAKPALPAISSVQIFSGTIEKPLHLRVAFGFREKTGAAWTGSVSLQNGRVLAMRPWHFDKADQFNQHGSWSLRTAGSAKGVDMDLLTAEPSLPGSLDDTLVTIHSQTSGLFGERHRGFTFRVADLRRGSIYLPEFFTYVTTDVSSAAFIPPKVEGKRIRQMIPSEPEQTYSRASREIPKLDPWERQWGGPLYLPLAADASWQKFAFEIGGNPYISKNGTKALGHELKRLQWEGDRLSWKIGTGSVPYYREDRRCAMSVLEGYLPIAIQKWQRDGFDYEEEAFATLLDGPLDAMDGQRSEQTPAVLVLKIRFRNTTAEPRDAHIWLHTNPEEQLELRGNALYVSPPSGSDVQPRLRAVLDGRQHSALEQRPGSAAKAVHFTISTAPGAAGAILLKLPFVSDWSAAEVRKLEAMDEAAERKRVIDYWTRVTASTARFTVPESNFNLLSRGVAAHIRLSAAKDPVTGLLMLPAASYVYRVFANETCFQTLLLDTLGQHKLAEAYLEPILRLQGSKNFPGKHKGMEDAIFHGLRINEEYDYTASHYGLDHGTVLWTLGEHYLYTRNRAWFERIWPNMRKAIDWIVAQRHSTMLRDANGQPAPEYGLLPASALEDNSDWAHWFANNSFSWAGMDRAARALEDLKHPEAARVRKEADAFLHDLRTAVLHATESAAVTRLRDGTYSPWVPVEPYQRLRRFGPIRVDYYQRYGITEQPNLRLSAIREALYGPIILLNLGVFQPDEPIANWILDDWEDNLTLTSGLGLNVHGITDEKLWFSQGGMVFQSNLQNPLLVYLKRHETPAAIRSSYNNFVACFYPGPNVFTEEYRAWEHPSGPFYKSPDEAKFVNRLRDMLVLEQDNTLWLAGGVPRDWLASRDGVRVDHLATYFGEVSYLLREKEPGLIEGEVTLPLRNPARENWLSVHVPKGRIVGVTINNQEWRDFDPAREAVRLPAENKKMSLQIRYR